MAGDAEEADDADDAADAEDDDDDSGTFLAARARERAETGPAPRETHEPWDLLTLRRRDSSTALVDESAADDRQRRAEPAAAETIGPAPRVESVEREAEDLDLSSTNIALPAAPVGAIDERFADRHSTLDARPTPGPDELPESAISDLRPQTSDLRPQTSDHLLRTSRHARPRRPRLSKVGCLEPRECHDSERASSRSESTAQHAIRPSDDTCEPASWSESVLLGAW
ncbi:hypothetical protein K490DRAFT_65809 [Saccharata proteae CBS 121410]|uniref:Uncharacterized protein n=1 Tax=Saccharata proteae CBS 121410 TaxID=1314787 RepID=A0A9P4LWV2_9PEZI|nr:hypothetical protein K490DRAFT_65809 [Saccharata proteae CBS 121410]